MSPDAIVFSWLHISSTRSACGAPFNSGSEEYVEESGAQLLDCDEVVLYSRTGRLSEAAQSEVDVGD